MAILERIEIARSYPQRISEMKRRPKVLIGLIVGMVSLVGVDLAPSKSLAGTCS